MLRSAPVDVELSRRVYWLIQLRWLASSAVIYGAFVATSVVGVRLDPLPLYLIGAAIAVYNSLFLIALKWGEVVAAGAPRAHPYRMANIQILVDLFFLTLLLHFSGGVENPFSFYFIFHVIIASILLSRGETFLQATFANGLYSTMVLGEALGLIPHVHLFGPARPDLAQDGIFVGGALLVVFSTLYLAAYMATSIVGRMRERDREILRLNRELEGKAGELGEAYSRLANVDKLKSDQLQRVSREIKAPLTAIQSALRSVLDGFAGEVPAKQGELLGRAERRSRELLGLVADLLALSRAREAEIFSRREPVDLGEVVERVIAARLPAAASRGISLISSVSSGLQPVLCEPCSIEQMLSHLVSNAVNYTPSGGRVELKVDSVDTAVIVRVADTGIGIPAADIPRVFHEFFRAENARRYVEEGAGLGLSIVRSIVESHGGEIVVDSQVGSGTTFTVTLPCRAVDQDVEPPMDPSEARGLQL